MTIKYDKETDAIFAVLSEGKIVESEERSNDVIVDYDAKDEIVAIEILHVKNNEHTTDLPFVLKSA